MNKKQAKGIADLPIVIILCVFLAALAAGLSTRGMTQVKRLEKKQKAIQSFNELVETCQNLNYATVGEKQNLSLNLNYSKIQISEKIAQLKNESETLKTHRLPLPLIYAAQDNYSLQSGDFQVKLAASSENHENEAKYVLELLEI